MPTICRGCFFLSSPSTGGMLAWKICSKRLDSPQILAITRLPGHIPSKNLPTNGPNFQRKKIQLSIPFGSTWMKLDSLAISVWQIKIGQFPINLVPFSWSSNMLANSNSHGKLCHILNLGRHPYQSSHEFSVWPPCKDVELSLWRSTASLTIPARLGDFVQVAKETVQVGQ